MWHIVIGGIAIVGAVWALNKFWDEIVSWLNTVAADAVEKALGYQARQKMFKAVAVVDRVVNKIRNNTTVYSRISPTVVKKTVLQSEAYVSDVDKEVLAEIDKKGYITQEIQYTN